MLVTKLKAIALSILIVASLPSASGSFHPTLNKGGHDSFTTEATKLKREVHKDDHDGGKGFNEWMDQAIEGLRTGSHDEDSTRTKGYYIGSEKPIGPNGDGNFYKHYYDPDTGKGLDYLWLREGVPVGEFQVCL